MVPETAKRDLLFVGAIFLALFLVWLATGGPHRPQARTPFIVANPQTIVVGTSTMRAFRDPLTTPEGRWTQKLFSLFVSLSPRSREALPPVAFVYGAAGAVAKDPSREFLAIGLDPAATTSVTISGWRLVSRLSGAEAVIPEGVEDFRPTGQLSVGPITLFPGDVAFLTTGASPVGVSFLTNRCTGYLSEVGAWFPPLVRACPNPAQQYKDDPAAVAEYGALCLEILARTPACTTPKDLGEGVGARCDDLAAQAYSYAGCYVQERAKKDFWAPEWRIFFGLQRELWGNRHDIIDLIDTQGNVVSSLRY